MSSAFIPGATSVDDESGRPFYFNASAMISEREREKTVQWRKPRALWTPLEAALASSAVLPARGYDGRLYVWRVPRTAEGDEEGEGETPSLAVGESSWQIPPELTALMAAHGREQVIETAGEMAANGWFSRTPEVSDDEEAHGEEGSGDGGKEVEETTTTTTPLEEVSSDEEDEGDELPPVPRPHALPVGFNLTAALQLPRTTRAAWYRSALAHAEVELTETFEEATARLADDPRSRLLATVGEQKVAFAEYRQSLVEREVDAARSRAAVKRSRFMADLAAAPTAAAGCAEPRAVRRAVAAAAGGHVDEYPSSDDEIVFQVEQAAARSSGGGQTVGGGEEEAEAYRARVHAAPSWHGSRSRWTEVDADVPSVLARSTRMRLFLEEVKRAAGAEDAEYGRIVREQARDEAARRATLRSLLAGEKQRARLPPTYAAAAAALGANPAFAAVASSTSGSHPCEIYDEVMGRVEEEEGEVV
jgi:hypothetical protein